MTVTVQTNRATFAGNDVTTAFPFLFKAYDEADIVCAKYSSTGVETPLVKDSDFSVALNDDGTGTVTYPISGTELATGETLLVRRIVPNTQTLNLAPNGPYDPGSTMRAIDENAFKAIQNTEEIGRARKLPPNESATADLPPADQRKGLFDGYDVGTGAPTLLAGVGSATDAAVVAYDRLATGTVSQSVASILSAMVFVSEWDPAATGLVDDNSKMQAAIDYAETLFLGGSLGGGGAVVIFDAKKYLYTGLVIPSGVSLRGHGINHTLFLLDGVSSTGIKCVAADTGSSADQVAWCSMEGIGFFSNETTPTSQVQWNMVGFTRCTVRSCFFEWFDGCTAIQATGSTLAGSGGPAMWHNSLHDCFLIHSASRTAGGTAIELGDDSTAFEKVTAFKMYGGRIASAGSGTGMKLKASGCQFYSVVHENLTIATEVGSAGTRGAVEISFFGCYWENNTTNRKMFANAEGTYFAGSLVTGGAESDSGLRTLFDDDAVHQGYAGNTGGQKWEVVVKSGSTVPPVFRGLDNVPAIAIENLDGDQMNISNGASGSSTTQYLRVLDDGFTNELFALGTAQLTLGADGVGNCGSAANRFDTVYATTGAIDTSDRDEKDLITELDAAEKACALECKGLIRRFKFKSSVEKKDGDARWHFGVMAQDLQTVFANHDLNAHEYGLFCYDEWDDVFETIPEVIDFKRVPVLDERGAPTFEPVARGRDGHALFDEPPRPVYKSVPFVLKKEVTHHRTVAGSRYGVRYTELLAFIIGAL